MSQGLVLKNLKKKKKIVLVRFFTIQFQYYCSIKKIEGMGKKDFYFRFRRIAEPRTRMMIILVGSILSSLPIFICKGVYHAPPPVTIRECYYPYQIINSIEVAPCLFACLFLIIKFVPFKDPFGIKIELFVTLFIALITVVPFLFLQVIDLRRLPYHSESFQPVMVLLFFDYIYLPWTLFWPLWMVYKDKKKYNSRSNSNSVFSDSLKQVLETPILLESFQETVIQHWCSEALLFALELQKLDKLPKEEFAEKAKEIVDKFIRPGAVLEININHNEVKKILALVEQGNFKPDLFDKANV